MTSFASLTQVNETDEKVEKELEGLREKHSRCVKELREVNSELGIARQRAEEFEMKKDKELERLRTHLLQVCCDTLAVNDYEVNFNRFAVVVLFLTM